MLENNLNLHRFIEAIKHQKIIKMKKTFRMFGMILFVMLMCVGFSACSSDDDENDKNLSIVGTWVCENSGVDATIEFYTNNTFYWCEKDSSGLDEDYGTYQIEGDIIIIRWDSDTSDDLPMRWKLVNDNGKLRIIAQDSTWRKK
ncbi:MAG: hypothetical protein HDS28_03135 [Bacteroides sp.]|nr:hypothetical protein [Bacteroides sp.]